MDIGYLLNQYPNITCTFIRREIAALESLGLNIERISIRRVPGDSVDPADELEQNKTCVLLENLPVLFGGALLWTLNHPLRSISSLRVAIRIGQSSHLGLLKYLIYWLEALALAHWFSVRGIEHIHTHFATNASTVAMLSHIAGGPHYSMTIHGPEDFDSPISLAMGQKVAHAEFVSTISEFARSQIFRWTSVSDWPKIHIIHCGVDSEFLDAPPTPVPDNNRLVCVGRLCEQKGQLLLVQAIGELIAEGLSLELVLVGDGPMGGEIEAAIQKLQIASHVKITGWQSAAQVREHIVSGRAMVLPSFAEGLPVVIMEALALGRPVISTYIAGIPELVENKVNGWLITPGSFESLKSAIRQLLQTDLDQLQSMGLVGRQRVIQQHDCRKQAELLLPLFIRYAKLAGDLHELAQECVPSLAQSD